MTEEEYKKKRKKINQIFFGAAIAAIILWVLSGFLIDYYASSAESRGTFGDMFGMINALFSGLALGGVIYTILLQRLELELQRDEIRYSSEQLKGQKEILDRQNFEDKFFRLLEFQASKREAITIKITKDKLKFFASDEQKRENTLGIFKGKEAFQAIANGVQRVNFKNDNDWAKINYDDKLKYQENMIKKVYKDFFNEHIDELGHYFRSLYHIIKLTYVHFKGKKNELSEEEKFYVKILCSSLSNSELITLAYNGMSEFGKGFRDYDFFERYKLLSNINFELDKSENERLVFAPEFLINEYPHLKKYYDEQLALFPQ